MAGEERTTLVKPPEPDPNKAPIENALEVTELKVLGPDIFTNTRQPWQPPDARGIYGGSVIAQCLAAAHLTVPDDFLCHSCHCYFLLAGSATIPILFHVERVRDGRSFATRTVQARQKGRCIFTTTISFVREHSAGVKQVRHALPLPEGVVAPADDWDDEPEWQRGGVTQSLPVEIWPKIAEGAENAVGVDEAREPHERKCRQWTRARGHISAEGGHQAHLNALAYMSDSYFIGTVTRVHGLWRFSVGPEAVKDLPEELQMRLKRRFEHENLALDVEAWSGRPRLGMLVSLDHSIYFHEPRRLRADEWMFTEMETPWAGDGRGVVTQRVFAKDGTLLATCVQEGVVRLTQDGNEKGSKL